MARDQEDKKKRRSDDGEDEELPQGALEEVLDDADEDEDDPLMDSGESEDEKWE